MDMKKISEMIDKVASSVEDKGLMAEAAELDSVSNALDKMAETMGLESATIPRDKVPALTESHRMAESMGPVFKKYYNTITPAEQVTFGYWLKDKSNYESLKALLSDPTNDAIRSHVIDLRPTPDFEKNFINKLV